jgi:hypothetical protein
VRPITIKCKKCGGTLQIIKEKTIVIGKREEKWFWCPNCGLRSRYFPEIHNKKRMKASIVTQKCHWCGNKFEVLESLVRSGEGKYCSLECERKSGLTKRIGQKRSEEVKKKMSKSRSGSKHWNWKGGVKNLPYCPKFTEYVKERVRNHFKRKCYLCGKPETKNNNKKLSVHHVNYDKGQGCSGTWLLIPLCNSCHTKTNFNRDYWETYFTNCLAQQNFECGLEKQCPICKSIFTPYNGYIKYCSEGCAAVAKKEQDEKARWKYHVKYRKNPEYLNTLLGSKPAFLS